MVGMEGAKHLLDLGEDEILELIEEGRIAFAWNIGLGERREVRILRKSIDSYLSERDGCNADRNIVDTVPTDEQALRMILPPGHQGPFLTNGQVQRSLNCVSDHVLHLVEAGALALVPKTTYRRGPAGAALVTVDSFTKFIRARRML